MMQHAFYCENQQMGPNKNKHTHKAEESGVAIAARTKCSLISPSKRSARGIPRIVVRGHRSTHTLGLPEDPRLTFPAQVSSSSSSAVAPASSASTTLAAWEVLPLAPCVEKHSVVTALPPSPSASLVVPSPPFSGPSLSGVTPVLGRIFTATAAAAVAVAAADAPAAGAAPTAAAGLTTVTAAAGFTASATSQFPSLVGVPGTLAAPTIFERSTETQLPLSVFLEAVPGTVAPAPATAVVATVVAVVVDVLAFLAATEAAAAATLAAATAAAAAAAGAAAEVGSEEMKGEMSTPETDRPSSARTVTAPGSVTTNSRPSPGTLSYTPTASARRRVDFPVVGKWLSVGRKCRSVNKSVKDGKGLEL